MFMFSVSFILLSPYAVLVCSLVSYNILTTAQTMMMLPCCDMFYWTSLKTFETHFSLHETKNIDAITRP